MRLAQEMPAESGGLLMVKIETHLIGLQWGSKYLTFHKLVYPECPYAACRKDEKSDCRCTHKLAPGVYCGTMNIQKEGYALCPFDLHKELQEDPEKEAAPVGDAE